MPIANYSTEVPIMKTLGEIQGMLVTAGAQALMTEYVGQLPASVAFRIERSGLHLHFRLPADWRGVQAVLRRQKGVGRAGCTDEQSQRVAWRIVRDWVRAQLALVEAGCAQMEQVMLPYLLDGQTNETLYEKIKSQNFGLALPAPKGHE